MKAPSIITSKINKTKAKAAPEIPLLPEHVFILFSSFLILYTCIISKLQNYVSANYCVLSQFLLE